ncbi:RagB/SusD family nutrient uptake outer membrane protein [Arsenicibacter rosenii]|uniref:RagB/SusD family nutrient uptake outer membrane protein n=1 Tax=Arsenicibacter rosenii TaxID=1750698 RepID=A0A1S2VFP7_9BACT|nr:RagB/SusD family nutrient uptake outer membrane protein [Arsenicibacter rosenii]OIN57553.1 RagB/SusD family nutrient uptake outer membrane protein [Arsenicibacter rosenii]
MNSIIKRVSSVGIALTVTLLSVVGCRDYLEVQPQSQISISDAFSNVANATNAVIGVYDELMGDNGYGIRINMYYPYDSDEIIVSGNIDNGRRGIGRYQLLLTNTEIRNPFLQLYRGVEKANLCIEQIPLMPQYSNGTDAEKKELRRLHGEVLTLRAQFLFELIRNWGDVPAPMQPAYKQTDLFIAQADRDVTYAKLIEDLRLATDLVPWRTEAGTRNERVTKGAVKALRAKLALFRGGYALRSSGKMERNADYLTYYKIARDECADLLAKRGEHTLNPSFEDIWRKLTSFQYDPNGEIIFEAGAGGSNSTSDSRMGNYNGPSVNASSRYGVGGGGLLVLPNYFYAFDSTDTRRDVTVTMYAVGATNIKTPRRLGELTDGKFRKDWRNPLLPGTALNVGYNWPFIRFADVLLMFAEAENELNGAPTAAAISAFEEVRKRAYAGNTARIGTTPTTKAAFFDAIVNERYLEFGSEGIRKFDLIRWNLLAQKIQETRDKIQAIRDSKAPYNIPRYLFWRNNGEEIQWLNSFYKTTALTTAPTGWNRLDWTQHLTGNLIDGLPLHQGIARFFVTGKSELFPYDQATVDAYQGKLKQNPGY